jgi:hypothetical protein
MKSITSFFANLFKKKRSFGTVSMAVACFRLREPVALKERSPSEDELDQNGRCLYGFWDYSDGRWNFCLQGRPDDDDTHFLPANSEVLPETIFKPQS